MIIVFRKQLAKILFSELVSPFQSLFFGCRIDKYQTGHFMVKRIYPIDRKLKAKPKKMFIDLHKLTSVLDKSGTQASCLQSVCKNAQTSRFLSTFQEANRYYTAFSSVCRQETSVPDFISYPKLTLI
jgi:hypothetical protein